MSTKALDLECGLLKPDAPSREGADGCCAASGGAGDGDPVSGVARPRIARRTATARPTAIAAWLIALAGGVAYLVYAFAFAGRSLGPIARTAGDALTLPLFILAALAAAAVARAPDASRRRTPSWSEGMHAVAEATAFFNVTPNEDAIRQRLAETVAALTGTVSLVTDRDGRLAFRAGGAGTGALDDELQDLAYELICQSRERSVARRGFRAHLIESPHERLGVVLWRRPHGVHARLHSTDEHVELLTHLASAAIVRASHGDRVRTRESSN